MGSLDNLRKVTAASVESRFQYPGDRMSRSEMESVGVYHRKRTSWIKGLDGSLMQKVQVWKGKPRWDSPSINLGLGLSMRTFG